MHKPVSDTVSKPVSARHALPEPALSLLRAAVQAVGEDGRERGRNKVAQELGISRSAVSTALEGKYPARTDKLAALIIERLGRVQCPHLAQEISGVQCKEFYDRDAPTSSPLAMRHWRACQECPNNLSNKGSKP